MMRYKVIFSETHDQFPTAIWSVFIPREVIEVVQVQWSDPCGYITELMHINELAKWS